MEILYILLVLLVITRVFGELAERIGQPALVGELVSGIVLGAVVAFYAPEMPLFSDLHDNKVFGSITDLGMFFLMLLAGVEMQPQKILHASVDAFFVAVGGMILPLGLGFGLGYLFLPDSAYKFAQAFFIGTALAITAVPATVRILMDLGKLNSRPGQIIISAAVFDDVLSLVLLAWLTGFIGAGAAPGPAELIGLFVEIVSFFVITAIIGHWVFPWVGHHLKHIREKEFEFSILLVAALTFAVLAEVLSLHFIVGAFIAGLFFGRKTVDITTFNAVHNKVSAVTLGLLAPIFFASVGMNMNFDVLTSVPGFLILLVSVAFTGKMLGAGLTAWARGLNSCQSSVIGVGMSARGAVELIVADIALRAGLFDHPQPVPSVVDNLYSAVVVMAIVTTLVTPVLLKFVLTSHWFICNNGQCDARIHRHSLWKRLFGHNGHHSGHHNGNHHGHGNAHH